MARYRACWVNRQPMFLVVLFLGKLKVTAEDQARALEWLKRGRLLARHDVI